MSDSYLMIYQTPEAFHELVQVSLPHVPVPCRTIRIVHRKQSIVPHLLSFLQL